MIVQEAMEAINSYTAPPQAAPESPATPPEAPAAQEVVTPPVQEPEFLTVARELEQARAELARLQAQQAPTAEPEVPRPQQIQQTLAELAQIRAGFDADPALRQAIYEKFGLTDPAIPEAMRQMYARQGIVIREQELRMELDREEISQRLAALQRQAIEQPQAERQQAQILDTLKQLGAADEYHLRLVVPHYQIAIAQGHTHEQALRFMGAAVQAIRGSNVPPAPPPTPPAPSAPAPIRVSSLQQLQAARGGSASPTPAPAAQALGAFFKQFR